MKINGYEIALSEEKLDDILNHKTRNIELIDKNCQEYQSLTEGNKKALEHLVQAAKYFTDIALEQDHELNIAQKKGLEKAAATSSHAAKALRLFNMFQGVEGHNGIETEPIEIFKGIKAQKGRNFYPADLSVSEFHEIIEQMLQDGENEEIRKILSVRTMVRRSGKKLRAIDYTEYFADAFSKIANELEVAAHYTTDEDFKDYLGWQAQALLQNNEDMDMLADKHWAVLQNNNQLEFTVGRESYDDELTPTIYENKHLLELLEKHQIEVNAKDSLGVRVGIINKKGTDLILQFKSHMPELAKLMPLSEQYTQSVSDNGQLKQSMVDADIAMLTGDYARCRGGITLAQNLPNNDKLAVKTGGGRRNVYHRQIRQGGDKERESKILEKLVAPEFHKYYDSEADHLFVIGHENGHSLGPDNTYQRSLGNYKSTIEEHKADMVSITFMPEYVKTGIINEETLKKIYTTWVVKRLFLKAKPVEVHRVAELIHFNYLLERGAFSFDKANKVHIHFDKFHEAAYALLEDTIALQLSRSPEKAKDFIDKYTAWGEKSQYIAKIQKETGIKNYIELQFHF
ncbi:MAG: hypothetical protein IJ660_00175 [Alphaproteobacteria bacterium]|nr:hypothetical protein [Alphaproteobacteria bacterium]